MPKERRNDQRHHESECSPYRRSFTTTETVTTTSEVKSNDWKDVLCPVCMEHPHNAILLVCTSRGKGCRPFMCDTSYRHSNCFDQYCKMFNSEMNNRSPKIRCPLCRGDVKEWIVVEKARRFCNEKRRPCACETCRFSGTYRDLRKHARSSHPRLRPSEVDAGRESEWRRMEWRRELGDMYSSVQNYPIMDGLEDEVSAYENGEWFNFFLFVQINLRSWRSRISTSTRIGVWGEVRADTSISHDGNESEPSDDDSSASQ